MAIYSYACSRCEEELEQTRRIVERDELRQHSVNCAGYLIRGVDAPGAVWAPTSTGSNLK